MSYNLAIVGATGMVGRQFIDILVERNFPIKEVYMFASKKSANSIIKFDNKEITVEELNEDNIKSKKIDIALFSAGGDISLKYAPIFAAQGAVVIDNSSAWRMDPSVPLVVPEVNAEDILWNKGIIANPNCSTIQAMVALKPLYDNFGIKRVIYSTYQAVSGAGVQGLKDLEDGLKGEKPKKFPRAITNNLIPHIDVFLENGYTKEEMKMIEETKKILHDDKLKVTATTVRVPVFYGHSESINVELNEAFQLDHLKDVLKNFPGIVVQDNLEELEYPTPLECQGKDEVFIGRIRRDFSVENGVNLWVVADNIRKGAALNAVQIAEYLIKNK
ncbi:aspartate-semialdehyde dehydrogenase [Clostridium amylolyticum]|uniref:Aspartate-semialdehyde dehydrogenase n=1 Tax=Clostridium amylolyticum TaxID=1121298 RepID=A0A1M6KPU7_9CLOT|nr:aspartate-semialdehyde dehydrogenase [Clostridium amylolyticum]SHJ60911.1 aspartate-semialdehyde dehydrogenase [Clostridium amylolyticum]